MKLKWTQLVQRTSLKLYKYEWFRHVLDSSTTQLFQLREEKKRKRWTASTYWIKEFKKTVVGFFINVPKLFHLNLQTNMNNKKEKSSLMVQIRAQILQAVALRICSISSSDRPFVSTILRATYNTASKQTTPNPKYTVLMPNLFTKLRK